MADSILSDWSFGRITACAIIFPSSLYLIWRAMSKRSPDRGPKIPLYGEKRALLEKFIFVESDYVGIVLGRNLRNIRRIEHETRTFINLVSYGENELRHNIDALRAYEDAASSWDNEEDVPSPKDDRSHFLRVHAQTKDQITLVEMAIEALMTDAKRRKNSDEMLIPRAAVGYVIGRNGYQIKKMQRTYRVNTTITQTGGELETVRLEGTPEGIEAAKIRILELIDRIVGVEEKEPTVEEQLKQMVELKEKLEEKTEMW